MKAFYHLLANNGIAAVANFTVWFAVTFYVFLETQSVFATSLVAGSYLVLTASCGIWFGGLVDHHKKKTVMLGSSVMSFVFYVLAYVVFLTAPEGAFKEALSPYLWALIFLLIIGVIIGNLRTIAMPTVVTLLVPEDRRDKANGLVGMLGALSFGTVSVISGLLIGFSGMNSVFLFVFALTLITLIHLLFVTVPEVGIAHTEENPKKLDLKGTFALVIGVPGLAALILFTTFNNFLGGVFMALMDAYGLSLVNVQTWGILLGVMSFSFLAGGAAVAKWGLGKNPLKSMLLANLVIWTSCALFTLQPSLILLVVGMLVYMSVVPYIEASEQTLIQKVVPFERQGRVFGFAQSVEQMASPVTAFLVGPLTQFVFIPFMTTGAGVALIGDWFGVGPARGIALVFTAAGIIGIITTILAFRSHQYKLLSRQYLESNSATTATA